MLKPHGLLTLSLLTLLATGQPADALERPFTANDLVNMARVTDPQPSPDGSSVAYVLRTTDREADRGRTDLWIVAIDGTDARRLTTHEAADFHPRWAPDGRSLYFLSTRSGSSQVWRLPLAGGEAEQVTHQPLDVGNLVVSPAGGRLAYSMEVFPDCPNVGCTEQRVADREGSPETGQLYDRLFVRHWDTFEDGRRSHLFVHHLTSGRVVDVSAALEADVPSKPFGGSEEIAFSPNGSSIVFTARTAVEAEPWSTNFDLYVMASDGSGTPRNLTASNPAWDTGPVFSPDGTRLAYRAMVRPGYEADRFRVRVMSLSTGASRALTPDWDRSPGSLMYSADGKTLYATAGELGQRPLFAIDTESGAVRRIVAQGTVRSPAIAGDHIVFGHDDLTRPVDLFRIPAAGGERVQLTHANADRLAEIEFGEPEQFTFQGWNDETVHAYLVKPVGFDPERRYPLAFLIHGGPQGSFGNNFHYRWNPQSYAAAGFAAVMVDFHGSTGYGQAFTDSIRGDWGGKPLEDLQKGLAAALERNPWIDPDRACALGASYGGYMVNWIAGRWSEPFRCLVNHDGIFDQRMMYYTTEELWFPEWEHGGTYFDNPEGHERHNPADYVESWDTPLLVIHGALDYRVPETQGFAAFTAAKRRGVPARFLYFPDENHWVLKPANSVLWHETVLGWLDRWTAIGND